MACKKCGGSGDIFVLAREDGRRVTVPYKEMAAYLEEGYQEIGTIECSMCGGFGK